MVNQILRELTAIIAAADDDEAYSYINKKSGVKIWRNADGQIHRDGDLPAVIYASGSVFYYKNDKRHRDGGLPATIWADGDVWYFKHGKLHRDGSLPAVIGADGTVEYFENGNKIEYFDE